MNCSIVFFRIGPSFCKRSLKSATRLPKAQWGPRDPVLLHRALWELHRAQQDSVEFRTAHLGSSIGLHRVLYRFTADPSERSPKWRGQLWKKKATVRWKFKIIEKQVFFLLISQNCCYSCRRQVFRNQFKRQYKMKRFRAGYAKSLYIMRFEQHVWELPRKRHIL